MNQEQDDDTNNDYKEKMKRQYIENELLWEKIKEL